MRTERTEWGSGEAGGEGETTVMGGGISIEGTGTGEARREPGMTAGVPPTLADRTYGEVYDLALRCPSVSVPEDVGFTYCVSSLGSLRRGAGTSIVWLTSELGLGMGKDGPA